jgi:hypothetical protein
MFQRYLTLLCATEGVSVDLYACEVTDVLRVDGGTPYRIHAGGPRPFTIPAHHILFVTGHPQNRPAPRSLAATLARHSQATPGARYIGSAYPLERQLGDDMVPPGCAVGVLGLGLTAIDVFLYLTEGRGGVFVPIAPADPIAKLKYVPSGREPAVIVGVGPSGLPTCCRPVNAKEGDPSLEHRGVFFTVDAIRALRDAFGRPVTMPDGAPQRQLDFERHAFPLVVLEMAYVYYKTLFGEKFGDYVRRRVEPRYRRFLRGGSDCRDADLEYLLEPVNASFDEAAAYVNRALREKDGRHIPHAFADMNVLQTFLSTLELAREFGGDGREPASPWRHPTDVYAHRFDWRAIHDPLSADDAASGPAWRAKLIACIDRDNLNGAQGNLQNPVKAACDGVWRDLRAVFSELVDRGGLLAESQRRFVSVYLRYYNRLSNGAGLEATRKILALIENGILDVSVGPSPAIAPGSGARPFRISGPWTGVVRDVDVVVEGKLHTFDPELDASSLYPSLLRRGLIRKWRNPGSSPTDDFVPGGLDLSERFHPLQRDGGADARLTFLGVPAEGVLSFQSSAARPHSNSYVLNNVATWADELLAAVMNEQPRSRAEEHVRPETDPGSASAPPRLAVSDPPTSAAL